MAMKVCLFCLRRWEDDAIFFRICMLHCILIMVNWLVKKFDDLTVRELYAILRLRSEVFVVEQTCVFQDIDNKDQPSYHLMGWENNILVGYTRLLPPGI